VVEGIEDLWEGLGVGDQNPDDLADESCDRGRFDSFADYIADEQKPAPVGHAGRIVEVAAHVDLVAGWYVLGGQVDSRDRREIRWQQGPLEHACDPLAFVVNAGVVQGARGTSSDLLKHGQVFRLLVDDRRDNPSALEAMLVSMPVDTVAVGSGEEALKQLLIDDDYAVIILDAQMPDMDGFETAEHIKRRVRTRSVPIIFLTAVDRDAQLAMRGYAVGAVDYLTKPFEPWILRAKVSVLVDLWMKTHQLENDAESAQRRLREGRRLVSALDQAVVLLNDRDADEAVRVLSQAADQSRDAFV